MGLVWVRMSVFVYVVRVRARVGGWVVSGGWWVWVVGVGGGWWVVGGGCGWVGGKMGVGVGGWWMWVVGVHRWVYWGGGEC